MYNVKNGYCLLSVLSASLHHVNFPTVGLIIYYYRYKISLMCTAET